LFCEFVTTSMLARLLQRILCRRADWPHQGRQLHRRQDGALSLHVSVSVHARVVCLCSCVCVPCTNFNNAFDDPRPMLQSRPFRVATGSDDAHIGFYAGPPFKLDHKSNVSRVCMCYGKALFVRVQIVALLVLMLLVMQSLCGVAGVHSTTPTLSTLSASLPTALCLRLAVQTARCGTHKAHTGKQANRERERDTHTHIDQTQTQTRDAHTHAHTPHPLCNCKWCRCFCTTGVLASSWPK